MTTPAQRMVEKVRVFMNGPNRNAWLHTRAMTVYIRNAPRLVTRNKKVQCLDVANIGVYPQFQRRGIFTEFMNTLVDEAFCQYLCLECVHSDVVLKYCRQNGWKASPVACMSWLKETPQFVPVA